MCHLIGYVSFDASSLTSYRNDIMLHVGATLKAFFYRSASFDTCSSPTS